MSCCLHTGQPPDWQYRPLKLTVPQQEPVVVTATGIIHPFGVGEERVEQGADLEQLMPIPTRSRQTRHLNAEADMAEADLGDQPLETDPTLNGLSGPPEVVINHD